MKKRILIALNEPQLAALKQLMDEDLQSNQTAFFVGLLGQEVRRRKEAVRTKVGRPKKESDDEKDPFDYSDDLPKNIPYFNEMIGPRQYADKEEFRNIRHRTGGIQG
jgi:hypothetical protein